MLLLSVLSVMIHSRMSFVLNYHKVGGVCQFNYFMGTLLRERQADLYRSKGVLSIEGQGDTKFVFQVTPAGASQVVVASTARPAHATGGRRGSAPTRASAWSCRSRARRRQNSTPKGIPFFLCANDGKLSRRLLWMLDSFAKPLS